MNGRESLFAFRPQVWEARCHFCGGQARPFYVPDALWPAALGDHQACFNCFYDALGTHDVLKVRHGWLHVSIETTTDDLLGSNDDGTGCARPLSAERDGALNAKDNPSATGDGASSDLTDRQPE